MVIFVQDNAACNAIEGLPVVYKVFIFPLNGYLLGTVNIFADFGNAEAAFIIRPVIAMHLYNMGINENLFNARCIGVVIFVFFIIAFVGKYLCTVYYKKANVPVYLRRRQTYAIAGIHGFPHVFNKLW